jgi:hypothetical protein
VRPTAEQTKLMSVMRASALKATQPSPYSVVEDDHGRCIVLDANDMWVADVGNAPRDAEHIAAASPANVLTLLDIIGGLLRENDHQAAEMMATLDEYFAANARVRRNNLANDGVCINGRSHGKATHGCRCEWCHAVHRIGVERALNELAVTLRPPGYRHRKRGAR